MERVLERQVRELASCVLGHPQSSTLDRSAEADMRHGLSGHKQLACLELIRLTS
jgi:hypothetical protein